MFNQNVTMRKYALGNFAEFSKAMFSDGALQVWLDGQENKVKAPNENLSREMMELFVLGVNRYSETDVRELARAFTGYQVSRSSGDVTYNARRIDTASVTVLGKTGVMSPEEVIEHLVSRNDCAQFVAERIWYRFVSSQEPLPQGHPMIKAFANRDVYALMKSLIESSALSQQQYSMVKSPVEWFVAVCRALNITPSKLTKNSALLNFLNKLAQVPFDPPNVGGWPTDDAWLSSASAQFRASFATWLVAQGDLSPIENLAPGERVQKTADLLGVVEWSSRTKSALEGNVKSSKRLILLAICSPEYLVSA
jgi:uncharacterized protein (DUF1800 family)